MLNIQRNKYIKLMEEVENLEDEVEEAEKRKAEASEIQRLNEQLAEKRNELARVSDGCGTAHHHS